MTIRQSVATRVICALLVAVAGCSGGDSPADGGEADAAVAAADASVTADAAPDLATASCEDGGIACAGFFCCGNRPACGSNDNGATGFCCGPLGNFCGESGTPATICHHSADCPPALPSCCEISAGSYGATCRATCGTSPLACLDGADCPNGQSCCPYNPMGPSFRRCVAADAGAC